jgi:hypothetical protein
VEFKISFKALSLKSTKQLQFMDK